ncbi:MAG: hypothetical protein K2L10_01820 [Ruminococcus sp.]|nr:hypothetical protein [Ruminococcus sp.]
MAKPDVFNTMLTKENLSEAFRRALNDMTDEQINARFAEIEEKIAVLEKEIQEWTKS